MNELAKRILFAIPAAAFFIWMNWLGEWFFAVTIILISYQVVHEIIRLMERMGMDSNILFPYSIALWILLSPYMSYSFEIGLVIFLLFIALQTIDTSERSLKELVTTIFAGIYGSLGFLCLLLIRDLFLNEQGFLLVLILMFMVWGNDVFAYFGGKTFGKHPLAPSISPNKTWEGFFSGFLGAGIGLLLIVYTVPIAAPFDLVLFAPLIFIVSTFGPIGDLMESKLKRAAGVKDSSSLLPGHGGFFDRFDALLLAAPSMYAYLRLLDVLGYVSF